MRKALPLVVVAALFLLVLQLPARAGDRGLDVSGVVKALNGSPSYLGTVAVHDGGSTNNWTTPLPDAGAITPFDAGFGNLLLIQCDQATLLKPGNSSTQATATGVKVDTDEKFYLMLTGTQSAVAIKASSGASAYCDFYKVD